MASYECKVGVIITLNNEEIEFRDYVVSCEASVSKERYGEDLDGNRGEMTTFVDDVEVDIAELEAEIFSEFEREDVDRYDYEVDEVDIDEEPYEE